MNTNSVFLIERRNGKLTSLVPEIGIFTSKSFALEALILALEPLAGNLDEFCLFIDKFKTELKQAASFGDVNQAISNMLRFGYNKYFKPEVRKYSDKPWFYSFIYFETNEYGQTLSPVTYEIKEIQLNEFLDPWKNYKSI